MSPKKIELPENCSSQTAGEAGEAKRSQELDENIRAIGSEESLDAVEATGYSPLTPSSSNVIDFALNPIYGSRTNSKGKARVDSQCSTGGDGNDEADHPTAFLSGFSDVVRLPSLSVPPSLKSNSTENERPVTPLSECTNFSKTSSRSSPPNSAPTSPKSPKQTKLKKDVSSGSLLRDALSAANPFKSRSAGYAPIPGPSECGVDSSEVQDILRKDSIPDLEAVNRALEAIENSPKKSEKAVEYTDKLVEVAKQLREARNLSKKLLEEAMDDRERNDIERCRSKCISIVHTKHADVEAKVLAYNMLSTLASPGNAVRYLKEAENLIHDHSKEFPRLKDLLQGVLALKDRAKARDAKGEKYGSAARSATGT